MHRKVVGTVAGPGRSRRTVVRRTAVRVVRGVAIPLLFVVLCGGTAPAQTSPRGRPAPSGPAASARGASDAAAEAAATAVSREELLRRFDLNFDGKIDEAEGEIGRSKLRREREEEEEKARLERETIDPLTGRPREEAKKADPKRRIISIDDLLPERDPEEGSEDQVSVADPAAVDAARRAGKPAGKEKPRSAARQMPLAPAPGAGKPGILSGGVRAGAPPARPGYGAPSTRADGGTKTSRPLNAGRPAGSVLPGASAGRPQTPINGAAGSRGAPAGGQAPSRPQTGRSSAPPAADGAPRVPLFPERPIN